MITPDEWRLCLVIVSSLAGAFGLLWDYREQHRKDR